MLSLDSHQKVTSNHLKRTAFLYIRQSTLRQIVENKESTKRQYALREKAVALGWPIENVVIIDKDQGKSGASIDRSGFQQLVTEVGLGKAGVVIGLEVSRLARNSVDWHRLLEICALTNTLILDEDGIYNPGQFNDRLLLGLKGSMSEAELHLIKARLQGGILAKAKRCELETPLPVGLTYDPCKKVVLDPNKQIQQALRTFFSTFKKVGSASATVAYFKKNDLKFPRNIRNGPHKGEVTWVDLVHHRALQTLHNPRYAGAFFYGRTKPVRSADGSIKMKKSPKEEWTVFKKDVHKGYITWEEHESNIKQLKDNSATFGHDRRRSPPREGPALLQGLTICGICGKRMTVRYHNRKNIRYPDYVCQRNAIENNTAPCQRIPGFDLDKQITRILIECMTPKALEITLQVQEELESRVEDVHKNHELGVLSCKYEAEVAQRRFMQVDPDNRMVADTLEADWNEKLKRLTATQEKYNKLKNSLNWNLKESKKTEILELSTNFPKLWNDPSTSMRDKKRMIRLIIEDVTLTRENGIEAKVRYRGGAIQEIELPAPRPAWAIRKTDSTVVQKIDELLNDHTHSEIAEILNDLNIKSGTGHKFNKRMVLHLRTNYRLKSFKTRLIEGGYLTLSGLAKELNVTTDTVRQWRRNELLETQKCTDRNEYLFKMPTLSIINSLRNLRKRPTNEAFLERLSQRLNEVQYEV